MTTPSLFVRNNKRRTHGNTITSKANRKIEETLAHNLSKITNRVIREVARYSEEQSQQTQQQNKRTIIDTRIKPLMNSFVTATFRKHVTDSYLLGINYVSGSHSKLKTVPSYITSSDVDRVKQITESYSNRFWDRITKRLEKEEESEDNDLMVQNIISPLAIGATNETLNTATVTKVRKFTGRFSVGDIELSSKEAARRSANDLEDIAEEILDLDLPLDTEVRMEWVTAEDEKVCDICEDMAGEYSADEVPEPIEDSHPNCRCRIMVSEDFDFEELAQEFLDLE